MESAALFYEGNDIPAEWDGLKGKKVVVVCRPLTDEFSNTGAARALAEAICDRLKAHVKKIQIIDPEKVAKLRDEKGIDDYLEIGRRLKAEKVLGVDIESFSVLDGQTLFRGRSTVSIQVYDVAEKQRRVAQDAAAGRVSQVLQHSRTGPPGSGIPQSVRGCSRRADCPPLLSPRPERGLRQRRRQHSLVPGNQGRFRPGPSVVSPKSPTRWSSGFSRGNAA